jgi:hypothetical protein
MRSPGSSGSGALPHYLAINAGVIGRGDTIAKHKIKKERVAFSYANVVPEGHSANRSLSTIEPVCGTPKWKLEDGAQRPAPETRPARIEKPKIAGQRLGRASLTRGNVADSHTPSPEFF